MTVAIVILLALVLFAYAAVPLLLPRQADPLPSERDPTELDLEEERDALLGAIRELELREDLSTERRSELRARYEAKAAKVLRALDERQAELKGQKPAKAKPTRRAPYGVLSLLSVALITSVVMSQFVLPRIGEAAVTISFEEDIQTAEAVRDLQRAVNRDPSLENRLALADAYWQLDEAEEARDAYRLIAAETGSETPAVVYQRLGYLALPEDFTVALGFFEQAREADPENLDVLYALGELYYSLAQPDNAIDAFESLLAQDPEDAEVQARLADVQAVAETLNEATENPTEDNLLALANTYWQLEDRERASDIYVNVLSEFNPHSGVALSRIGQTLFMSGQNAEAIEILGRAREVAPDDLDTLLFLGNAHFSEDAFEEAIGAWEDYVEAAGSEDAAGRVPGLIENARTRLASATAVPTEAADSAPSATGAASGTDTELLLASGGALYQTNCAVCHGQNGGGGTGPRLAGNNRAVDEANVRNIIRYGRGAMPGYGAVLSDEELNTLVQYVTEALASEQTSER